MVEELVNGQVFSLLLPLHAVRGTVMLISGQPLSLPYTGSLGPFPRLLTGFSCASHPGLMQSVPGLQPPAPVLQRARGSTFAILRPALHTCLLEDLLLCLDVGGGMCFAPYPVGCTLCSSCVPAGAPGVAPTPLVSNHPSQKSWEG